MNMLQNPAFRILHDPAMKTAKVRDGQASAFEQGNTIIFPLRLSIFFSKLFWDSLSASFRSRYREFTSSNMGRLNCFLRFSAVSMGM